MASLDAAGTICRPRPARQRQPAHRLRRRHHGPRPQIKAARQPDGSYDYEPSFRYVRDYIQSADLAIANLEVTLAGPPYTGYPQFSSPAALAAAASEAGFDILTTAANTEQRQTARWLLEHGSDAVIGGHPHVVQDFAYDAIPGNARYPEPVVYSMGNFVSNQRDENCDGGIMIELDLQKRGVRITTQRCSYLPYWVHRGTVDSLYHYYVVPSTDAVEHPDRYQIEAEQIPALRRFSENTRARLSSEPFFPEHRFYENQ